MAKKTSKSQLMKKLGTTGVKTIATHKNDEMVLSSGGDLPDGIENGVAKLVDCVFDTYKKGDNKGEFYFRAAGIVIEPKQVGSVKVEGLRTQIMEPICATPNRSRETVEDHLKWVINQLKLLGIDGDDLEDDGSNLEEVAEALAEDGPHFNFRTWKGSATEQFPNPRVNHDWRGICEYIEDEADDVVDETGEEEDEVEVDKKGALIGLAKLADKDNEEAQNKLTDLAEKNGLDAEDYPTWIELANTLSDVGEEEEEEETETVEPEKGDVYLYKPPKARKAVQCEVTAVFATKETCNLKKLEDGRSYKSIPWTKLIADD